MISKILPTAEKPPFRVIGFNYKLLNNGIKVKDLSASIPKFYM